MSPFASHLSLREPHRTSLVLNPESADAALYVDFKKQLPKLERLLDESPPVALVQGEWGLGKSHTLAHARWMLEQQQPPRWTPVWVTLSGLPKNATFTLVYSLIMQHVRPHLEGALKHGPDPGAQLANLTADARGAISQMTRHLRSFAPDPQVLGQLRYWIQAQGPTPVQAARLGLGSRLKDGASPSDLVAILRAASRIHRAATGRGILLVLDESASLAQTLGHAALLNINEGLRSLVDPSNEDLGVLLGFNKTGSGATPIVRVDTMQRLQDKVIDLPALEDPSDVRTFILNFWEKMGRTHLFEPPALDHFTQRAISVGATREQAGRLTPRRLLQLLDGIAKRAVAEDVPLPITVDALRRWLPSEA